MRVEANLSNFILVNFVQNFSHPATYIYKHHKFCYYLCMQTGIGEMVAVEVGEMTMAMTRRWVTGAGRNREPVVVSRTNSRAGSEGVRQTKM